MKYGIWIEEKGFWTGWFGLASANGHSSFNGTFVPWSFDSEDEAEDMAMTCRRNRPKANVQVKPDPPLSVVWDEKAWAIAVA